MKHIGRGTVTASVSQALDIIMVAICPGLSVIASDIYTAKAISREGPMSLFLGEERAIPAVVIDPYKEASQ